MATTHTAFMSYTRFDDQHNGGHLTLLCERLAGEVQSRTGQKFEIFQDTKDIEWGQQVGQEIDAALQDVTFLIPILTPSFFNSRYCRYELEQFLRRERILQRSDLVLPIYYIACPILEDAQQRATDPLAQELSSRQRMDWRTLRFDPIDASHVRKLLAEMGSHIRRALQRTVPTLPGSHASAYPSSPSSPQMPASSAQIAAWQRMLANKRESLQLIEERISEFVSHTTVPLDLLKDKRRTEEEIADLERQLGLR